MLNLDPAKLLVILVLGLVVVGPEKLPSLARQLVGAWRTVTRYREQFEGEIKRAIPDLDLPRLPKNPSAMMSGFVSDLLSQPSGGRAGATTSEAVAALDVSAAAAAPGAFVVRGGSVAGSSAVGVVAEASGRTSNGDDPAMN